MLRGRDGFNSQKEVCGNTVSREKDAFQRRTAFQRKNGFPEKNCLPEKKRLSREGLPSAENTSGRNTDRFREKITLDKVSFGYREGQEVLHELSFCFQAGKHYAVVGRSGCGKSTLLSLLLGYYPDYSGSISYDSVELRELPRECLGNIVAYVSQDTFLFQDTILNNITLFDEKYTLSEVESAVEQAGLAELVASLPEVLSTTAGENGRNFSGGERQRLSLARALLRKSRVLLLDEFTANLDRETARKIEERIMRPDDCLTITVTHRLEPDMRPRYDGILNLEQA
ncbi:MAG: ABC transporter ATP-binding protein [Lachnospiraceae bacterium]|jgi:ABC-type multidrug transport system fused ATPase/permease subunit|nr:ABC transporter ATP-binding protein [Lachnospiraceae bacterium]